MANINENYLNLQGSYLFANIAKKVNEYQTAHPDADIIRLGIGDVTLPLAPAIIDAMSLSLIHILLHLDHQTQYSGRFQPSLSDVH